jgi:N-glycosylase/DNA lyase
MLKNTDLNYLDTLPTEKLKNELMKFKGVGSKVADCIMLFGFHREDVFPTDTWIKKVYSDETKNNTNVVEKVVRSYFVMRYKELSGYAQQYLFYNKRSSK